MPKKNPDISMTSLIKQKKINTTQKLDNNY